MDAHAAIHNYLLCKAKLTFSFFGYRIAIDRNFIYLLYCNLFSIVFVYLLFIYHCKSFVFFCWRFQLFEGGIFLWTPSFIYAFCTVCAQNLIILCIYLFINFPLQQTYWSLVCPLDSTRLTGSRANICTAAGVLAE